MHLAEHRPVVAGSEDSQGEWFAELIDRAINGPELPDYAGVPDCGASAGPPITSSARP